MSRRVPTPQTLLQKQKVHREVAECVVQQMIKSSGQNEEHEPFLSTPLQGDAVDKDAAASVSDYTWKGSRDARHSLAEKVIENVVENFTESAQVPRALLRSTTLSMELWHCGAVLQCVPRY